MYTRRPRLTAFVTLLLFASVPPLTFPAYGQPDAAPARPQGPVTERGEIDGAEFLIEIPEDWNGGLLMYAHGYLMVTQPVHFVQPIIRVGHRLGYAVAQSKYSRQGWAAREGILETEALRQYFVEKYGKTYPTIISGNSQGGFITFATIERYPEVYDGAFPMCGVPESALDFFKKRVFDTRLLFDYYFPGLPGSVVEFPDGLKTFEVVLGTVPKLIAGKEDQLKTFMAMTQIPTVETLPLVLALWSEMLRELQDRTGGNAFDNRDTLYTGSGDDVRLNREIPRHTGDAEAMKYLREWATLTGDLTNPVVSLHTLVDQLVPASSAAVYDGLTRTSGTSDWFVQLYVDSENHCQFTEEEMVEALTRLTAWIKEDKRPEAGDVTRRKSGN